MLSQKLHRLQSQLSITPIQLNLFRYSLFLALLQTRNTFIPPKFKKSSLDLNTLLSKKTILTISYDAVTFKTQRTTQNFIIEISSHGVQNGLNASFANFVTPVNQSQNGTSIAFSAMRSQFILCFFFALLISKLYVCGCFGIEDLR